MSKPIPIKLAGKSLTAMPAGFDFLKANQEQFGRLEAGQMTERESQMFMGEVIVHCIRRAMPDVNVGEIEAALDAVEVMRISREIGVDTGKQIARAMGVQELGEAEAG